MDRFEQIYERLRHLDQRRIAKPGSLLEVVGKKVHPRKALKISPDEDDNRVYACAVAARAHYIVTENTRHFKVPYRNTQIVNVRQPLAVIEASGKSQA